MGLSWTIFRLQYELKKNLGVLPKKFPSFAYNEQSLNELSNTASSARELVEESRERFFFQDTPCFDNESLNLFNMKQAVKEGDAILSNNFKYFSYHDINLDELNWHYSPFTEKEAPSDIHWSRISDLGSKFGDIKWIWELSRFTSAYTLVRAYAVTKESKYVEKFWMMFEDFIKKNPPELGPNYKCGQEMSFRIMAWTFALFAFFDHPESTDSRLELMLKAIYHHADHIEKHFDFALKSVKNNHSVSEAAGMYTVGIVFPFFNKSEKWRNKGKKYVQSEAMWQIYKDGSYKQSSMNYHRLALQDLTWVLRLAQINQDDFAPEFMEHFKRSIEFLYMHQESQNGRVPNYGMNDGAYIHPLTSLGYLDYRPALQAAWIITTGKRLYRELKVDEIACWLTGNTDLGLTLPFKRSMSFNDGGYFTIRNNNQFGLIRCTTYKDRPVQADMLHFDLWDGEYNIFADAGTYSYNTDKETLLYFIGTSSHNTLMINNQDQMKRGSRFMWHNWTKSKLLKFETGKNMSIFEGEHYGYSKTIHRRSVIQMKNYWIIIDDVFGDCENKEIELNWLFGQKNVYLTENNALSVDLPNGTSWKVGIMNVEGLQTNLRVGSMDPVKGWRSLYYGHKEPFPQLSLKQKINEPTRIITLASKENHSAEYISGNQELLIDKDKIRLNPIGADHIFNKR